MIMSQCCLWQVTEHEKGQQDKKPSIMQTMWAAMTKADDSEQAETASSRASAEGAKPQVAVITASGVQA